MSKRFIESRWKLNRSNQFFIPVLVSLFFLPYFPGTPFRIDQLLGLSHIVIALLFLSIKYESQVHRNIFVWSVLVLVFVFVRMFANIEGVGFSLQIINQYSYMAAGAAIYSVHRKKLIARSDLLIFYVVLFSAIVNILGIIQWLDPSGKISTLVLHNFSGEGSEALDVDKFASTASLSLLGGGRVSSIFVGPFAYGIFNIIILAVIVGALREGGRDLKQRSFIQISFFLTMFGGFLSTSKVFFFGSFIFFAGYIVLTKASAKKFLSLLLIILSIGPLLIYLSDEVRVLGDLFAILVEGSWLDIFRSRFGSADSQGYLEDVMYVTFEPFTLIFGLGPEAAAYKYSDFEFRQVLLIGGVPLFVIFYGLILYVQFSLWRYRLSNPYALPFFLTGLVLLIAASGVGTHLQGRSITLWQMLCFALALRETVSGLVMRNHYGKN